MRWTDVIAPPSLKTLRQFAGLWLIFFIAIASWRWMHGSPDIEALTIAALGVGVGAIGLWRPAAIRFLYSGWMIAAFPIGWTVSRLMLAVLFYGVFTPVALVFKLIGRDALRVRRQEVSTHWRVKPGADEAGDYFRQS